MSRKNNLHGFERLRLTSSGSKIINQIMMFVVIGVLPLLFPQQIKIENRNIVFVIVSLALLTSFIFEFLRIHFKDREKIVKLLLNFQLLTSVFLLTPFLFYFGRINGPFFILYLLTVMESFLNLNVALSYFIVGFMISAASIEYAWLVITGEIIFGYISIVQFVIRILSLLFLSAYGYVLATKTILEEQTRRKSQEYASNLEVTSKELEEANRKLKNIDRQKDEFISVVAHELRAPMTAIKGFLSMVLEGDTGNISAKTRDFIFESMNGNERLIRLVNNMLNVNRIEEGRMVYEMGQVHLTDVLKSVYSSFKAEAEGKKLKFVLETPVKSDDLVMVDKDRIYEVVLNLVGNAIKYTDKGSVTIKATYTDKGKIKVEVVDTGKGITEMEIPKLFQKFKRAQSSAGKTIGTGLGLYISKLLIEKFNGKIGVESSWGKGSNFWFELPLVVQK